MAASSPPSSPDDELLALGYTILPERFLAPPSALAPLRSLRSSPIFNPDKLRKQSRTLRERGTLAPRSWEYLESVRLALEAAFPSLRVHERFVLRSERGCLAQAPHCDYVPPLRPEDVPCGAVLALEDGTTLDLWPGSHLEGPSPLWRETVTLSAGEVLVFRGDLVHAGSAYPDRRNTRVHFYLDHEDFPREDNRTWLVGVHGGEELRERMRGL